MSVSDMLTVPHRRYNPLTGEWVLVSSGRTDRPWQGAIEPTLETPLPSYDPACYLCPGNSRAGGARNPDYPSTFVFTNDFSALFPDTPRYSFEKGLLRADTQRGTCRVVCFSPRHDLTLARLELHEIEGVIDVWADQVAELSRTFAWVQVFENRGEMMGASNPHPHGQIWAGDALPVEVTREDLHQSDYFELHGSRLLADYARDETGGERVVVDGDEWLAVVPFWAVWPFETMILPRAEVTRLEEIEAGTRRSLAMTLKALLTAYDRLFESSMPYSMGWHGAPPRLASSAHWQLHGHMYPPLLRSSTIRKFMVGYELLAEKQRDLSPEEAADRLRSFVS